MVSGSTNETKDRIVRTIRNSDDPVLSAADIADRAEFSKRTVNNHISELVDEGQVQSTKVGNATAYYIARKDYPAHDLPDHHCKRCGRAINSTDDLSRVETRLEYRDDDPSTHAYILCRFCQTDLTGWLNGDDNSMYDYLRVHKWSIPKEQLEDVRNDDTVQTCPDDNGILSSLMWEVHATVEELGDGTLENGVSKDTILSELGSDHSRREIEDAIDSAVQSGALYRSHFPEEYVAAK